MPRTETVVRTLFKFKELSEKAQDKALEERWEAVAAWNVDYGWWEYIYDDAATIGLTIEEFDLGNSKEINGKLTEDLLACCKLIRKNHGKDCETFKTAETWLYDYIEAFKKWLTAKDVEDMEAWELEWTRADWLKEFNCEEEAQDIQNDFRVALLQDYYRMLDREYDYQTSRRAIIESIQANELEFQADGSPA